MSIFRPRKFTFFPFLILFKRIESIDMTPCVISFLVYSKTGVYRGIIFLEAVLTSTHNLCFRAKIKKNI